MRPEDINWDLLVLKVWDIKTVLPSDAKVVRINRRGGKSRVRYKLRQAERRQPWWYSMLTQTASDEASASDGRHATIVSANDMLKKLYKL